MAGKGRNETRKRKIKRKTEEGRGKLIRKWGREESLPVKKSLFTHTQTQTLLFITLGHGCSNTTFLLAFLAIRGLSQKRSSHPLKVHKIENFLAPILNFVLCYAQILRFCKKHFWIRPLLGESSLAQSETKQNKIQLILILSASAQSQTKLNSILLSLRLRQTQFRLVSD